MRMAIISLTYHGFVMQLVGQRVEALLQYEVVFERLSVLTEAFFVLVLIAYHCLMFASQFKRYFELKIKCLKLI